MTTADARSTATSAPPADGAERPALRRPRSVLVSGTSVALASHLRWPPAVVRLVLVVATLAGGAGLLFYVWVWAFAPLAPQPRTGEPTGPEGVRRAVPVAALLLGAAGAAGLVTLVAAVAIERADPIGPTVATLALAGAAVAWSLGLDRTDPGRSRRYGIVVRTAAGAGLIALAALVLLTDPRAATAVLAVVMIVAGVGVLAAPLVVTLWTSLMAERAARVRQESRAEVAAHLHDSVLQSLALIQNRAEPGSEVARIARAQERELRDWLFAGTRPSDADFAAQLRLAALEIELQHPVRFDVVATGEFEGRSFPAVLAAAREAMTNAARHAGGEVSVYAELGADALEVWVRDRGPGFDPEAIPAGRLGVRESIVGRMARHGGSATITNRESGCEVALRMPLDAEGEAGR